MIMLSHFDDTPDDQTIGNHILRYEIDQEVYY